MKDHGMSTSYDHMNRSELIALLELQQSDQLAQSGIPVVEARQTKLLMLTVFAIGAWLIMVAYVLTRESPTNWFIVACTPLFSLLALLYWRNWEPAPYITVVLFTMLVGLMMPDPFVTQQVSMAIFLPPVLALVLITPRWMVIAAISTFLMIVMRANWQGAYTNPIFLAIFATLIGGLLICRRVLDLTNKQLEGLNRTLEQRIAERTNALQEALHELRASETELRIFRNAVDTAINAIAIADLNGIITYINLAFLQLWDNTPEQTIGQSVLLRWQTPTDATHVIDTVLREGRWRGELTMLQRNGSAPALQVHANIVTDEAGKPIRIMANFIDISERKRAEDELRRSSKELAQANQELARAARLKYEFLANMSHELRTPLTSILGRSELLQEDTSGSLTELQRRSVRSIEESGHHLLELINDILDLSKIEAGKMKLELQPVRIAGFVQSCLRLIAETATKKRLRVSTALDEAVTIVNADPRRLKQILVNLLANAVKFTHAGGEIGLEVRGNPDTQTVDLIVWDTGIGIAAADQAMLFQPFIQIDSSLSRQYEGTGLGLVLVAQLTTMHGGSVNLTSAPGYGSRFTVTLPWEPTSSSHADLILPDQHADVPQPNYARQVAKPLLLLVEDHVAVQKLLAEYLVLHGYRVTLAKTGREALGHAQTIPPDCIIMDIQLPDMDGLTAIRILRSEAAYHMIPILVLSAHAMPGDQEQALAVGANAYLSKPVRLTEFVAMISTLINTHRSNQ